MEELRFPWRRPALSDEEERFAIDCILAVPITERRGKDIQLHLDYPQVLMALPLCLRGRLGASPAATRDEAKFFYALVEQKSKHDMGLLDERNYCLGAFALIAGMACRGLSRREEARLWFDRADAGFLGVSWRQPHLSELLYQKLALRIEERQFAEVVALLPNLVESFSELGMREHVLKCRFIEGQALRETDQLPKATALFRDIARQARDLGNGNLLGMAYVDLLQIHAFRGETEAAFDLACEATPLLRQMENRTALAKLQLGLAYLLRSQGKLAEAVEAYRAAQKEFVEIEMRADVAAIQLVIADLLLDLGQEAQARWEVQMALPVIDEYKLVPEGIAALGLLRESLKQRINREALRDLHGWFRDGQ
jgi:tetratricopeptide (TPR) repeat protein